MGRVSGSGLLFRIAHGSFAGPPPGQSRDNQCEVGFTQPDKAVRSDWSRRRLSPTSVSARALHLTRSPTDGLHGYPVLNRAIILRDVRHWTSSYLNNCPGEFASTKTTDAEVQITRSNSAIFVGVHRDLPSPLATKLPLWLQLDYRPSWSKAFRIWPCARLRLALTRLGI